MNRRSVTQSLERIKAAIETARDGNDNPNLLPNYATGIRICDELISKVASTKDTLSFTQLMGRFNYFVSDSLPWTDPLLATIDRESKNIKKGLREDTS